MLTKNLHTCSRKCRLVKKWFQYHQYRCIKSVHGVRVRFAPSPTGQLHLGSLRTALYNYLFAKSQGGSFILRIEDTDQSRKVPGAMENLRNVLTWACLHPDEGPYTGGEFGPYIQSQRVDLYKKYIEELLDSGSAYRCFCTPRRLDLIRKEAIRNRQVVKYDGKCSHLTEKEIQEKLEQGEEYTVRLRLIKLNKQYEDLIYGPLDIDLTENEGDPILMKSDQFPTYHFANVVDDHLMKITHVLRGIEWQTSTPKHLMIYQAFGWTPPQYAHLPLIINQDGTKLSKRQGDIHVDHFIRLGYFPESVLNYITVPGGGFIRTDFNQVMTLEQLIQNFNLTLMKRNSGRLDPLHLERINQEFIKKRISDGNLNDLANKLRKCVVIKYSDRVESSVKLDDLTNEYLEQIIKWGHSRIHRIEELVNDSFDFLWLMPQSLDTLDIKNPCEALQGCLTCIKNLNDFEQSNITSILREESKRLGVKFSRYMTFLRLCLSGIKEGPSVGEIMTVLGQAKTIERLQHAIILCERNS